MPKTKYGKKIKNGNSYFFYRLRHKNLRNPRDIYGKTVWELEEKISALKYELDRGVTSSKAYFGDYLKNWLDDVNNIGKKPATIEAYERLYRLHLKDYDVAHIQLKGLTALDIQNHYKKLTSKGVSKSTMRNLVKIINPCIRYAFTQGKMLSDFSRSIILPDAKEKQEGTRRASRALSKDEQSALIKACSGTKWDVLIKTALYSGLRRGEIMALTWKDIDFEKETINVNKSYSRHKDETGKIRGMVDTPKTESSVRVVPLPAFVVAELRQHRAKQAKLILLLANKYENNNLVFCTDIGKYISISTIEKAMRTFSKEIGLDSLNMHDFRDTYATRLYELGYNEKTVQVLMGHSNIGVTMDIYTHVSSEMKTKNVYLLDELHMSLQ